MAADAVEIRVLGCLIEKQRTTPDVYPLSLNALRLACNQATNRDPVVDYDEPTVRSALDRLSRKGWVRLASGPGSRAAKYRHLLDGALGLTDAEISLLAVLMLRGPQTPGELRQRTERLYPFESQEELADTLARLIERRLAERRARRPGQKEERYVQLLGGEVADESAAVAPDSAWVESPVAEAASNESTTRVDELERRVTRLEDEIASLRQAVGQPTGMRESRP